MSKIGLSLNINVEDIEKARLVKGKKGTYLDMTVFVNLDEQDQYGNNGMIVHAKRKDEQGNTPILGNAKIFWREGVPYSDPSVTQVDNDIDFDQDLPF